MFETPQNTFADVRFSENITLKNLVIDYIELPFTQGSVTLVDRGNMYFEFNIDSGYPLPPDDAWVKEKYGEDAWRFGMQMEPDIPRVHLDPGSRACHVTAVHHVRDRVYRVEIAKNESARLARFEVGDRFVLQTKHYRYDTTSKAYSTQNINISNSKNVLIDNVVNYTANYMWCMAMNNDGPLTVRNSGLRLKPGSDRIMSGNSDGFHARHNRGKIIVEGCYFEGHLDDCVAISTSGAIVQEVSNNNKTFRVYNNGKHNRVGDTIMLFDPETSRQIGVSHIADVSYTTDHIYITTERPISDVKVNPTLIPPARGEEMGAVIYNLDTTGPYEVINNTFNRARRHAALLKVPNGVFSGNTVIEMGGCGVWAGNEVFSFSEGSFPSNLVIADNYIENCFATPAITVTVDGDGSHGADIPPDRLNKAIRIENNTFCNDFEQPYNRNYVGTLQLEGIDGLYLKNNTIINRGITTNATPVRLTNCAAVTVDSFNITDDRESISNSTLVDFFRCNMAGVISINTSGWTVDKGNDISLYRIRSSREN